LRKARTLYRIFLFLVTLLLIAAAIPVVVSDLFRQPYSPLWPTIDRIRTRLQIDPFPTGGGAPPQWPYWRDPADAMIYYRDITLRTADGLNLSAWYVPALEANAPTVLLCHGFLTDTKWSMLRLVPWLHEAGYNVMLFDFRGHGGSDRRPTTIGPKEALDVQAALDWLEGEGVDGWMAGLGMSMGAAALVNTAVQDTRLDALVLDSLFAEWENVDYAREYPFPPEWLVPGVPNPVDLMPHIHVPVFIIHGTADILVRVEHAHRLYDAANEPKALWINDSGHAWSAWTYPEVYQEKVLSFLETAVEYNDSK
jgi:alpha-beta hydrolase superfamily lysophospholipase